MYSSLVVCTEIDPEPVVNPIVNVAEPELSPLSAFNVNAPVGKSSVSIK